MYYCNVNGFKSKHISIRNIVDNLKPKIIVLCETKLSSELLIKKALPEYDVRTSNVKAGQSGIAIAIKVAQREIDMLGRFQFLSLFLKFLLFHIELH